MSLTERLALSATYLLFVDRFERSLRFSHLKFKEEAIYNGFMAHSIFLGGEGGVVILSDFREFSFFGPCGLCLLMILHA